MIYMTRVQKVLLAASVLVLIIISGTIYMRQERATEIKLGEAVEPVGASASEPLQTAAEEEIKEISVYILGCVKNPGVIRITEGTRLDEAVKMAGGAGEEADLTAVNLAYKLSDEDMIYIPKKGEEPKAAEVNMPGTSTLKDTAAKGSGKININTASGSELEALDGIGPAIAKNIINYRNEVGPFKSIEDIKNVRGIGEGRFRGIKDDITVE